MQLKVKNSFIVEDIEDEEGNKIGELKFNPSDARIVTRLVKCADDAEKALKQIKNMGSIPDLSKMDINSAEDAENVSEAISKINTAMSLEEQLIDNIFGELSDIFGKNTIELFTQGTKDIETILPILEFVMPYVQ